MEVRQNGHHKNLEVNNNKRKREEFKYGNYTNYYYKRLGAGGPEADHRLGLLESHPEFFRNKAVLDIGCNCGLFTINFAKQLLPASVLGVDIDGSLIEKARRDLEKQLADVNLEDSIKGALDHVTFRKANYILKNESLLEFERPQYEAILCLSVTKWIHLNYGDEGIKFMFKRIFKQLKPNGVLVLEAQSFETYSKRSKLSPEISKNFKGIQLKPDNFETFLLSDEIGFSESWCLADKDVLKQSGLAKGFHRPLQVFIKR